MTRSSNALWEYVEQLRHERGWSQLEVAERAGRDRQMFVRMQRGRALSHPVIIDLARAFEVPAAELLRRQGEDVDALGVVSSELEAPPLTRQELIRRASAELTNDELLSIVGARMQDVDADEDPLAAYEPVDTITRGEKEYTGRRVPPDARSTPTTDEDSAGA